MIDSFLKAFVIIIMATLTLGILLGITLVISLLFSLSMWTSFLVLVVVEICLGLIIAYNNH